MTTLHLLRASDHRRMPWKNGGGETVEIALSPPGASLEDFDWRVSIAGVAVNGPFSSFAGIDRTLVLLEGADMILAIAGRDPIRLRVGDAPLAFAADVATHATLTGGAITDFNVMTRRGRHAHIVEPIGAAQNVSVAAGATLLLFGDGLSIETADGAITLGYRDCARIDGPADVHVGQAPDDAALLVKLWSVT